MYLDCLVKILEYADSNVDQFQGFFVKCCFGFNIPIPLTCPHKYVQNLYRKSSKGTRLQTLVLLFKLFIKFDIFLIIRYHSFVLGNISLLVFTAIFKEQQISHILIAILYMYNIMYSNSVLTVSAQSLKLQIMHKKIALFYIVS